MNTDVGHARVGQWYTRWDKGEIFHVTRYDEGSRSIEIQTFDGDSCLGEKVDAASQTNRCR